MHLSSSWQPASDLPLVRRHLVCLLILLCSADLEELNPFELQSGSDADIQDAAPADGFETGSLPGVYPLAATACCP